MLGVSSQRRCGWALFLVRWWWWWWLVEAVSAAWAVAMVAAPGRGCKKWLRGMVCAVVVPRWEVGKRCESHKERNGE